MTTTALAERLPSNAAIEQVLIKGDLSTLTEAQRLTHYRNVCESLGLNPLTGPFDYLKLNGKLILYAKRDAAEQLRKLHSVSITEVTTSRVDDCYVVLAKAVDKTGRTDASTGVVPIAALKGDALANALMKAETKAKRRVTLSICGLGMLDETELDTMGPAVPTGYSVEAPPVAPALPPVLCGETVAAPTTGDLGHPQSAGYPANQHGEELPDDGRLFIARVDISDTNNANVKRGLVTFSDGRQASTIKTPLIALCEQLTQDRAPVEVWADDLEETRFGLNLLNVRRVPVTLPAEHMLTQEEIF